MVDAQSANGFIQRTMKDKMSIQSPSLGERLDREQLLIFVWNAGISAYNCAGLIASQLQMFNP